MSLYLAKVTESTGNTLAKKSKSMELLLWLVLFYFSFKPPILLFLSLLLGSIVTSFR